MQINIPFIAAGERVRVVELMAGPGDTIAKGEALFAVENDKAVFDVLSMRSGVIKAMDICVGDIVVSGMRLVQFKGEDGLSYEANENATGLIEVTVCSPYLGAGEVSTLIEYSARPGDFVDANQTIAAVQSGKAILDIYSPTSGILVSFEKNIGDEITNETTLALVRKSEYGEYVDAQHIPPADVQKEGAYTPDAPITSERVEGDNHHGTDRNLAEGVHLTPSERSRMRRNGSRQSEPRVTASTADVIGASAHMTLLPWPKIDFSRFGLVNPKPLSRIKKISGANLHRNWVMIPHVTNNDEADITELEALRVTLNKEHEKVGVKFTMLAFVIKAVVAGMKEFPTFNATLDGENLQLKLYYHIGFAADTPNGLVVPVIRDADKKGLIDIAKEMSQLSKLARDGKLKPDQMQGGCISISSLGGIGGTHFTPIINAPEVAILGLSRAAMKPVWDGKQFVPRLILPLSLSYDHRVIDGAQAARFNAYLSTTLADFRRIGL